MDLFVSVIDYEQNTVRMVGCKLHVERTISVQWHLACFVIFSSYSIDMPVLAIDVLGYVGLIPCNLAINLNRVHGKAFRQQFCCINLVFLVRDINRCACIVNAIDPAIVTDDVKTLCTWILAWLECDGKLKRLAVLWAYWLVKLSTGDVYCRMSLTAILYYIDIATNVDVTLNIIRAECNY